MKRYDYLIYIGRFQPCHVGHITTILRALDIAHNVIVVIGSAFKPRTPKNPWIFDERRQMIVNAISSAGHSAAGRVHFTYAYDYAYNNQRWTEEVQARIRSFIPDPKAKIGLIGLDKDRSTFYLKLFPQWDFVTSDMVGDGINASDVRINYFEEKPLILTKGAVSDEFKCLEYSTVQYLDQFRKTEAYALVKDEYDFIKKYKKGWSVAPYAPTFVTVDAVVVQSGHVLVVERGASPGKGNYALPGGFLNEHEFSLDGAIRELREETKLKIPVPVLKGSIKDNHTFDYPTRSLRGRTITIAYLFELAAGPLPKVKGSDDARVAVWIPLSEVDNLRDRMFEDHADIISYFVGKL